MEFRFIDHADPFLEQVMELGKRNSQTLGLMPRDAYLQQARKKCIVIAFENEELLGFCLFRITMTKHRIGITQVCVDSNHRKMGIAKSLLKQIQSKYSLLFGGMLVSCREDYEDACELWSRFGFVRKKRVRSRSIREERYLLKFWYSFEQKDLFNQQESLNLTRVVLDLNILIKLHEQIKNDDEIKQLLADWLVDEVEYCFANETFNEIHRDRDFNRADGMVKFLGNFTGISCNAVDIESHMTELRTLHPGNSVNHHSDRKQIAECKVCNVAYFITTDEELLSNRDDIYEKLGVSILTPAEFILEIDELKNRRLYEPLRLQGAQFEIQKMNSLELSTVVDTFLQMDRAEKKTDFRGRVNGVIAKGKSGTIKVIKTPSSELIAAYGFFEDGNSLVVTFIRIKSPTLASTLFYQLLVELIRESIRLKLKFVRLTDNHITEEQVQILQDNGFEIDHSQWVKVSIAEIGLVNDIIERHKLSEKGSVFEKDISIIKSIEDLDVKEQLLLGLEKKLWPLKFEDLDLPIYIVPIKPFWASQLFDSISSNGLLFGSQPELSWSKQNVYYRSVQPNVEKKVPGRILWYASQQKNFSRQKAIVGCSYLNNVSIGEAKVLFSTFRRFGIYSWKEISKLSKGNIRHIIKVLQFSDTEVFEKPLGFSEANKILEAEGLKKQTFVSPLKVSCRVFNKIYQIAR